MALQVTGFAAPGRHMLPAVNAQALLPTALLLDEFDGARKRPDMDLQVGQGRAQAFVMQIQGLSAHTGAIAGLKLASKTAPRLPGLQTHHRQAQAFTLGELVQKTVRCMA
jgi:hypothetical protein